ncbi:MAG TPA: pyruvate kinase [Myxococcales bacterium]|nr:pyruvate kinase [Myxococcales bacterium]HAN30132.1 pyruvate kinase [Myxococcales bacterium]
MRRHHGNQPRHTRIVATIGLCKGPNYGTYLDEMVEAGTDVIRLNMSHAQQGYEKEREILAWANQPLANLSGPRVAVLGDLQGPKARIGEFPDGGLALEEGQSVTMRLADSDDFSLDQIPMPGEVGPAVLRSLRTLKLERPESDLLVLFGDGELVIEVQEITADAAHARVVAGGVLGSRKGITIRGVDIDLDPFPDKDQRDLAFLLEKGIDFLAVSFVRQAVDLQRVRQFVEDHGSTMPKLIAKIETIAAIDNIEAILDECDGIMIARGDLGLQLGYEHVPVAQKNLAERARHRGKQVIVATQMLESMIHNPAPTRAEATDVFNAILDGGDAVMLSGETSVGSRPMVVVETIAGLALVAERFRANPEALKRDRKVMRRIIRDSDNLRFIDRISEEFALNAVQLAEQIPAFAVVSFTRTGGTSRRMSKFRSSAPLLAMCNSAEVARSLLLCFGVHPVVLRDFDVDRDGFNKMIEAARDVLRSEFGLTRGDAIVLTNGFDWPKGGTNSIRVLVEDFAEARGKDRRRRATGRLEKASISES